MPTVTGRLFFDYTRATGSVPTLPGIANVPIVLQDVASGAMLAVLTDTNGNFSFVNVPNGNYQIVEYYGFTPATPTPGDFTTATIGSILSGGVTPPLSYAPSAYVPTGTTNLDCVTPNTLFITVSDSDLTDELIFNGPVKYTPFSSSIDSHAVVSSSNLITAADNGTFGEWPVGTPYNTMAPTNPYPAEVGTGFTYVADFPADGFFTITNIAIGGATVWWNLADHTTGNETGRMMYINGYSPGAVLFRQTVAVQPNTFYLFKSWVLNLIKVTSGYVNPALGVQLLGQNGQVLVAQSLGQLLPVNPNTPEWVESGTTLASGANATITVQFISQGPAAAGNDYVMDDIGLYEVEFPELVPVKTCSASVADIDEVVTYTVELTNIYDRAINNVTFQDTVPPGLTFVPGSVTVNGVSQPAANPNTGFALPNVAGGATITVTFDAQVVAIPQVNPTINTATISYDYTIVVGGVSTSYAVVSNEVSLYIAESADMAVIKTGPATITAGELLTYTIAIQNFGPSPAVNATLTDTPPANLLNPQFSADGGATWSAWTNSLSLGTMAMGASQTILIRGTVNPAATGNLSNTANVSSNTPDPDPSNNTSTATVAVDASADVSIVKTASPASLNPGQILTYTLAAANAGPSVALNVVVTDPLPGSLTSGQYSLDNGVTWLSWSGSHAIGTMTVGQTNTILVRGTVVNSATGTITNTATIDSTTFDPDRSNNTSTATAQGVALADLSMTKTASPNPVVVGQPLTYTLTASNLGPSAAVNVVITDALAASLSSPQYSTNGGTTWLTWPGSYSVATLASGANVSILVRGTVSLTTTAPISNTATVGSDTADPDPTNNTSTITTNVSRPADVYITKTAAPVISGNTLTYMLTVGNNGPVPSENTTVTDIVPAVLTNPEYSLNNGVTWLTWPGSLNLDTLQAGSTVTVLIRGGVPASQTGAITNTATVASDNPDPDPSNNTSTNTTTPTQAADVSVIKTVVNTGTINPGDTLVYALHVANAGPSNAANVVAQDTLPASLTNPQYSLDGGTTWLAWSGSHTVGTMIPGASMNIRVRGVVAASASGNIVNTATANGTTFDPDMSNNTDTTATPLGQLADLSIVKTASPSPVIVGQVLTYTLVAHNAGPSQAVGVEFEDILPVGLNNPQYSTDGGLTWNAWNDILVVGNLNAGANFTLLIRATVDLATVGMLSNTAVVSSGTPDPDPTNNTFTNTTDVSRPADVYITKTSGASVAGQTLTYTLTVGNSGPASAANTTVTDIVPSSLTNPEYSLNNGVTFLPWPGSLNLDTLPVNSPVTILIRGSISPSFQGSITNTATVASDNPDPDPSNNTDTNTTTPTQSADVSMVKTVNNTGTINPGDTLVYTLTVANAGPSDALGAVISDPLPSSLQSPQYSLNNGTTWLIWGGSYAVGTMAPNASLTLLVRGVVVASAVGNVINTATGKSDTPDPNPDNNTDTTDTPLGQLADLSIIKTASPNPAVVGQLLTYTLAIHNAGPSTAQSVVVADALPAGMNNPQYSTDGGATWNTWPSSYTVPSLASGGSISLLIRATVDLAATGSLANTATVGSDTPDPDPTNNTSTNTTLVTRPADVYIVKTAGAAVSGQTLTYTLTVGNNGPVAAVNTVVTDTVPAALTNPQYSLDGGATWADWTGSLTIGTLPANSPVTILIRGSISPSFQGTIENTAVVASDNPDPDPSNNTDTDTTTPEQSADVSMVKTVNNTGIINPGDTLVYTLTVSNAGPSDAQNVSVTDTFPSSLQSPQYSLNSGTTWLTWPGSYAVGTIAAGATTSLLVRGVVAASAVGNVINTAMARGSTPDPDPDNNTDTTDAPLGQLADVSIVKTASPNPVIAGQTLTYTLAAANAGPSVAHNVIITDTVPASLTNPQYSTDGGAIWIAWPGSYSAPTLAAGATLTALIRGTVALSAAGTLTNTAVIASDTPDPDPTNNTSTETSGVNNAVTLTPVKAVDKAFADVGDTLTYTFTLTVAGSASADHTVLTDLLPAELQYVPGTLRLDGNAVTGTPANASLGTLAVGSHTLTFQATILSLPAVNPIPNSGSFAFDFPLTPGGALVPVTAHSNTVTTQVNTAAPVAQKTVDKAFAKQGDTIVYTVTIHNSGNVAAQNIVLTDLVPEGGTFVAGSLAVDGVAQPSADPIAGARISDIAGGGTAVVTFRVLIDHVPTHNPMVNSAEIQYDYKVDPNAAPVPAKIIQTNEVTTQVNSATLSAVKAADKQYADVGGIVTYTVTLVNAGSVTADSVVFTDVLASGLSYVAGSLRVNGAPVSGDIAAGVPLGSISSGAVVQFQAEVTSVPSVNPIPNTASVSYTFVVNPAEPPTAATVVTNRVDVQVNSATGTVVKSVDRTNGTCGDTLTYTSRITITGSTAAHNVLFHDLVPLGAQYIPGSFTVNGVAVPVTDPSLPVNIGTIQPGSTAIVVFRVLVVCQ